MRLVDTILSATDQPGRQYRAVVTQAVSAGSVYIPVNTEARITLVQSGGTWSAQLDSLALSGKTVPVTSSSVSATSPMEQVQQNVQKLGGLLGGLGGLGKNVPTTTSVNSAIATGPRVVLPEGTALTFTAAVPQLTPAAVSAATGAAPVLTSTASPGNVAAPQATGGSAALCEFTASGKLYYSAIFDAPNDNDKANWEVAWGYYINKQVDPFPGNGGCSFYRMRTGAEHDLQIHKSQLGAKLIETGWVYTGPSQLPPPAAPNPGHGK
jgi:hypothetical protein